MLKATEHRFTTRDQQSLFFRHWPSTNDSTNDTLNGHVLLFHRGHEHSGRVQHIVDELGLNGVDYFAWDARGHGQSEGKRGYSPNVSTSVNDINDWIQHLVDSYSLDLSRTIVIAQSVGAVLVSTWLHDYAPPIKCAVLASPAFKIKLYMPLAIPSLKLIRTVKDHFYVNSYVKPEWLTHDQARIKSYRDDPLITRPIGVDMLIDVADTAKRIVTDAQAIHPPVQLLISASDGVVHRQPQIDFYHKLGNPLKEMHLLDNFYHDTLGERDRAIAFDKIKAFIQRVDKASAPQDNTNLRNADQFGPTYEESARLSETLKPYQVQYWYWKATRAALKLGSRLSSGLKLGFDSGFDSGSMLDYVYQNNPSSPASSSLLSTLGKKIDQQYLNAIGWRGIRVRKTHIESLLQDAILRLQTNEQPVRILDIAAGHGRYILDALEKVNTKTLLDSIRLQDYSERNVTSGQALIRARGLSDRAEFVLADAFDREALAAVEPRPTLAVVSGLYELFSDNTKMSQSLAGLEEAISEGGYLIYTNQPWHPQLALIARALTSHRAHQAWVMRRRTQAEMDRLVNDHGFKKIDQRIDPWGMFSVSLAKKM